MSASPLWQHPGFRRLYFSSASFTLGTQIYQLALPLIFYELTRSAAVMTTVRAVELLPNLLLAMFIGVWVDRMDRGLREFRIRGVKTNIPFLMNVVHHEDFRTGQTTTRFIDNNPDLLKFAPRKDRASKLLNYLADTYPEAALGGDGSPRGRAEVNRWLAFVNSEVHPTFKPIFRAERFIDGEREQEALRANAITRLCGYFERLDAQLAGKDWLTGSRSFADPYLFVVLRWAAAKGVDLSGLDQLARFQQRMLADAGVQAAMGKEGL